MHALACAPVICIERTRNDTPHGGVPHGGVVWLL